MTGTRKTGKGEDRYREALSRHGLRDLQPVYRRLLRRLRERDPEAYDRAVERYRERVEPAMAEEGTDPVAVWLEYGAWLAARLHPGRTVAIDDTGLARPVEGEPPAGPLLLHLPEERGVPALALAVPEAPSGPQEVTAELLCG